MDEFGGLRLQKGSPMFFVPDQIKYHFKWLHTTMLQTLWHIYQPDKYKLEMQNEMKIKWHFKAI